MMLQKANFPHSHLMIRTRLLVLIAATAFLFSCGGKATAPPTAEEINSLWQQRKHDELEVRLSENLAQAHPDFIGLYCARTFFVLVKPNKAKALECTLKLKQIAEATKNQDFINIYAEQLAEIQSSPAGEFSPPRAEALEMLHSQFKDKYLTIDIGLRLKKLYITP
ncbi:MAG: hypothetical protein JWO82_3782 [Akkermansiaceae bacterium]|nr:hypothetical protein [Akkermansiaceae bacterium]